MFLENRPSPQKKNKPLSIVTRSKLNFDDSKQKSRVNQPCHLVFQIHPRFDVGLGKKQSQDEKNCHAQKSKNKIAQPPHGAPVQKKKITAPLRTESANYLKYKETPEKIPVLFGEMKILLGQKQELGEQSVSQRWLLLCSATWILLTCINWLSLPNRSAKYSTNLNSPTNLKTQFFPLSFRQEIAIFKWKQK